MSTNDRAAQVNRSIYDEIRDAIVEGELMPGARLAEEALATQFRSSRTPIREALLKLRQDGLVEASGRGLVVRQRTSEEILNLYKVRVLLEEFAAHEAAVYRSDLDLNRLMRLHAEMADASHDAGSRLEQVNREFHEQMWRSSHNDALVEMLKRLTMQLRRFLESTLGYPGRFDDAISEHDELISAIRDRQADRAGEIAARHMRGALNIQLEKLAKRAD